VGKQDNRPAVRQNGVPVAAAMQRQEQIAIHQGPLPPPEHFRQYNDICPGAAERILAMAENEMTERHNRERIETTARVSQASRGQWFAFIIGMAVIAGGILSISNDKPLSGLAAVLGVLVTLTTVFLTASRARNNQ
jgi:uncharacterized membrane protein